MADRPYLTGRRSLRACEVSPPGRLRGRLDLQSRIAAAQVVGYALHDTDHKRVVLGIAGNPWQMKVARYHVELRKQGIPEAMSS
jgi:hypothetical protein